MPINEIELNSGITKWSTMPIGRGGGVMQNAGATPLVWGALTAMGKGLGGLSSAWPRDTRLFSTAWLAQR